MFNDIFASLVLLSVQSCLWLLIVLKTKLNSEIEGSFASTNIASFCRLPYPSFCTSTPEVVHCDVIPPEQSITRVYVHVRFKVHECVLVHVHVHVRYAVTFHCAWRTTENVIVGQFGGGEKGVRTDLWHGGVLAGQVTGPRHVWYTSHDVHRVRWQRAA